jgi:hypothetical protein
MFLDGLAVGVVLLQDRHHLLTTYAGDECIHVEAPVAWVQPRLREADPSRVVSEHERVAVDTLLADEFSSTWRTNIYMWDSTEMQTRKT